MGEVHRYNRKHKGRLAVGLAAPQIGIAKSVAIILHKGTGVTLPLINPKIIEHSEVKVPWTEGCLSFPGKIVETFRYLWIKVACDNWDAPRDYGMVGELQYEPVALFDCVAIQHEIDHLQGILFFDRQNENEGIMS